MNTHLSWDTLNDYADDMLAPAPRAEAARHLDACAECRASLSQLREMLTSAVDAPHSIEPPAEAWDAIKASVERTKMVALPTASGDVRPAAARWRLAAAAIVLIAASSGITALFMRERAEPLVMWSTNTPAAGIYAAALPADVANVERDYLETVGELTAALDASRNRLLPGTVRAVERSLTIIDDAIAEARQALLSDPASSVLREILTKNYQRKVDLLRRTTARIVET